MSVLCVRAHLENFGHETPRWLTTAYTPTCLARAPKKQAVLLCILFFRVPTRDLVFLQALHGIKPSRVKSKAHWLKNCPKPNKNHKKPATQKASDANPPSQDWSPSGKSDHTKKDNKQVSGAASQPSIKSQLCVQLQIKKQIWWATK